MNNSIMTGFTMFMLASLLGFITLFFCMFIVAVPVCLLWNWLMPTIFGLGKITFLQAWGLSILSGLLLKSGVKSGKEN